MNATTATPDRIVTIYAHKENWYAVIRTSDQAEVEGKLYRISQASVERLTRRYFEYNESHRYEPDTNTIPLLGDPIRFTFPWKYTGEKKHDTEREVTVYMPTNGLRRHVVVMTRDGRTRPYVYRVRYAHVTTTSLVRLAQVTKQLNATLDSVGTHPDDPFGWITYKVETPEAE